VRATRRVATPAAGQFRLGQEGRALAGGLQAVPGRAEAVAGGFESAVAEAVQHGQFQLLTVSV